MPRQPVHAQIGSIWIDVSVRESHSISADVSDHPVETGSNVADHIRVQPRMITIEGLVTNTPIELPGSHTDGARLNPAPIAIEGEPDVGALGIIPGVDQGVAILGALKIDVRSKRQFSSTALHFTSEFDRVGAVHNALVEAIESAKLLTVVTALATYQNVALVDLSVDRERPAKELRFTATGRVLRIVSSQTAKLPNPVDVRVKPGKSLGKQATEAATATEQANTDSFASRLLGL